MKFLFNQGNYMPNSQESYPVMFSGRQLEIIRERFNIEFDKHAQRTLEISLTHEELCILFDEMSKFDEDYPLYKEEFETLTISKLTKDECEQICKFISDFKRDQKASEASEASESEEAFGIGLLALQKAKMPMSQAISLLMKEEATLSLILDDGRVYEIDGSVL